MAARSPALWSGSTGKDDVDTQKEAEAGYEEQRLVAFGALDSHACTPATYLPFL